MELIMPNVKQCMQLVNRAWNKASDDSIINCWQKCRILSNFERIKEVDLKELIEKNIGSLFVYKFDAENFL